MLILTIIIAILIILLTLAVRQMSFLQEHIEIRDRLQEALNDHITIQEAEMKRLRADKRKSNPITKTVRVTTTKKVVGKAKRSDNKA